MVPQSGARPIGISDEASPERNLGVLLNRRRPSTAAALPGACGLRRRLEEQMVQRLSCVLVLASLATGCGTADPEASDPTVNALEASGQVEFFVRIVGANGQVFRGESTNAFFRDSIPAIRFFSD